MPKPVNRPLRGGLGVAANQPLIPAKIQKTIAAKRKLWSLDTETTGPDFWHGCRPFMVCAHSDDQLKLWEWHVNPYTREISDYDATDKPLPTEDRNKAYASRFKAGIPAADKKELTAFIDTSDFVLHNAKFDTRALELSGLPRIDLARAHDTLTASHCLVSDESHKLKDLALEYLNIRDDDEKALKQAVLEARTFGKRLGWQIASEGHAHFPAFKPKKEKDGQEGMWKLDMWMPRAVCHYRWVVENDPDFAPPAHPCWQGGSKPAPAAIKLASHNIPRVLESRSAKRSTPVRRTSPHPWWTICSTYCITDTERTLGLWFCFLEELERQKLLEVYEQRRQLLLPIYEMEHEGATFGVKRAKDMAARLTKEAGECQTQCYRLAKKSGGAIDNLNSDKQLQGLLFGTMGVKPGKRTKTGYATDAKTLEKLLARTKGAPHDFILNLRGFRKREKAADYVSSYLVHGIQLPPPKKGERGEPFGRLHFNVNPTGTNTTRFSSSDPNSQNISKQENEYGDFNIRKVFGPVPGREWYSIDYSNIEMRIFAAASKDQGLIETFEKGYAVHCVFAKILWPKEYEECEVQVAKDLLLIKAGKFSPDLISPEQTHKWRKLTEDLFKDRYDSTLYQWTKNGNFALIYGAQEDTADATYHRPGGRAAIMQYLPLVAEFMSLKEEEGKVHGYIRTLGAGNVLNGPEHGGGDDAPGGYKLWINPRAFPSPAANYFVQGTAGWCMVLAINRCYHYLTQLNRSLGLSYSEGYKMIMTIHDEIVFDFPLHARNQDVARKLGKIMEQSGEDIGVVVPASIARHQTDWAHEEKVAE